MSENKSRTSQLKYGFIAIGLAAAGFLLQAAFQKPVYSDYASHTPVRISSHTVNPDRAARFETAFNSKNYREALGIAEDVIQENPEQEQWYYYKAIILVELNSFQEADEILSRLSGGSSLSEQAKWMAALSKLKQKEYRQVQAILETVKPGSAVYQKAQLLLGKL